MLIEGVVSGWEIVRSGVPQHSVLGLGAVCGLY